MVRLAVFQNGGQPTTITIASGNLERRRVAGPTCRTGCVTAGPRHDKPIGWTCQGLSKNLQARSTDPRQNKGGPHPVQRVSGRVYSMVPGPPPPVDYLRRFAEFRSEELVPKLMPPDRGFLP